MMMRLATSRTPELPTVISVASGKGGAGKTVVASNLALGLAKLGRRVLLLDADMGLSNVGLVLGLQPARCLIDVIEGRAGLGDTIVSGPHGLEVLLGGSGDIKGAAPDERSWRRLWSELWRIRDRIEYLVVDTPAGIGDPVMRCVSTSDLPVVVLNNNPSSFADAYGLLKVASINGVGSASVVTNMVANEAEGRALFARFKRIVERFLDVAIEHVGTIPDDPWIKEAGVRRVGAIDAFPCARASLALQRMVSVLDRRIMGGGSPSLSAYRRLEGADAHAA